MDKYIPNISLNKLLLVSYYHNKLLIATKCFYSDKPVKFCSALKKKKENEKITYTSCSTPSLFPISGSE